MTMAHLFPSLLYSLERGPLWNALCSGREWGFKCCVDLLVTFLEKPSLLRHLAGVQFTDHTSLGSGLFSNPLSMINFSPERYHWLDTFS